MTSSPTKLMYVVLTSVLLTSVPTLAESIGGEGEERPRTPRANSVEAAMRLVDLFAGAASATTKLDTTRPARSGAGSGGG